MKQKTFEPEMQAINRQVAILKPKQPFLDWNLSLPDAGSLDLKFGDIHKDRTVYLIPEFDSEDESLEFVYLNFIFFFEEELHGWYTDESAWPKMTLGTFKKWFDVEIHSVAIDLLNEKIEKEDW